MGDTCYCSQRSDGGYQGNCQNLSRSQRQGYFLPGISDPSIFCWDIGILMFSSWCINVFKLIFPSGEYSTEHRVTIRRILNRTQGHDLLASAFFTYQSHFEIPSGKRLQSYWTWPSRNSEFSHEKWWIFPSFFVNVYQILRQILTDFQILGSMPQCLPLFFVSNCRRRDVEVVLF